MKAVALLLSCILVAQASVLQSGTLKLWEKFQADQNRHYGSDVENYFRFNIFAENLKKIEDHNRQYEEGKVTYKMGINRFTDMTQSEFTEQMLMSQKPSDSDIPKNVKPLLAKTLPESVDWREHGAVSRVRDQGNCAASWAFSVTAATEASHFILHGDLPILSAQNVLDCSPGTFGCEGGSANLGLEYIARNKGVDTEDYYPYTAKTGTCHFNSSFTGAVTTGLLYTEPKDEEDLKRVVATVGPICVEMDASQLGSYESGIMKTDECSQDDPNHSATVIGYGTEDGQDYWLLKNSWGDDWGEEGYLRMARNYNNMCGIASRPCYPTV